jgi:hypothetical protein
MLSSSGYKLIRSERPYTAEHNCLTLKPDTLLFLENGYLARYSNRVCSWAWLARPNASELSGVTSSLIDVTSSLIEKRKESMSMVGVTSEQLGRAFALGIGHGMVVFSDHG